MCKRLFVLGIFLDNIKVPPSQTKCLLGESRNTRYNTRYKPKGYAAGVLGTSTRHRVRQRTLAKNNLVFCDGFVLEGSHR